MTAQIDLPDIMPVLNAIASSLIDISGKIDRLGTIPLTNSGEWLNGKEFCAKYHISRPTLYKRVGEGLIEVQTIGEDIKRYRIKEGA